MRSSRSTSTPASASSFQIRSATGEDLVVIDGQRDDRDLERGDADGPDDAVLVVVLLDHGGQGARDADAVAAHDEVLLGSVLVGEGRAHRLGVLGAELEDLADLDAASALERAAALGTAVSGLCDDEVGPVGDLEVAAGLRAEEVVVVLVGTDVPGHLVLDRAIGEHQGVMRRIHRAERALGYVVLPELLFVEQLDPRYCPVEP